MTLHNVWVQISICRYQIITGFRLTGITLSVCTFHASFDLCRHFCQHADCLNGCTAYAWAAYALAAHAEVHGHFSYLNNIWMHITTCYHVYSDHCNKVYNGLIFTNVHVKNVIIYAKYYTFTCLNINIKLLIWQC